MVAYHRAGQHQRAAGIGSQRRPEESLQQQGAELGAANEAEAAHHKLIRPKPQGRPLALPIGRRRQLLEVGDHLPAGRRFGPQEALGQALGLATMHDHPGGALQRRQVAGVGPDRRVVALALGTLPGEPGSIAMGPVKALAGAAPQPPLSLPRAEAMGEVEVV